MIRAHRIAATAQDDTSLLGGWNISPNLAYALVLLPGPSSCGVLLYADNALVATGAALTGTDQPCVLTSQAGQTIEMVDAELGWHLLLTTVGTEVQREIRINPSVDLPDEIHPVYGDDGMGLARATAAIDEAAHYRDDVPVNCPLGLGAGCGDIVSAPVDGAAVVGQVESITWAGTPDGTSEQAMIRRHVAIAPGSFVEPPEPPSVANDFAAATHLTGTSGNVVANDGAGLVVVAVNGLAALVGEAVNGDNGGIFTIAANGFWTFDPDGDFALLAESEPVNSSVVYHASDGTAEGVATLTITVSYQNSPPVVANDYAETDAITNVSGNVLTNDTDIDDDTLVVSKVAGSSINIGTDMPGSNGGIFTIAANGAWTFIPNGDFSSLADAQTATTSITYHVFDGENEVSGLLTITVSAAASTQPVFVGSASGTGSTPAFSVPLPAGVQAGDVVIVAVSMISMSDGNPGVSTPGYTEIVDLFAYGQRRNNLSVSWKIMGDTPDASVTILPSVNAGYSVAAAVHVWRGVDGVELYQSSTATGVSALQNPAISPATAGEAIIVVGAYSGAIGSTAAMTAPTGYDNSRIDRRSASGNPEAAIGIASKIGSGGTETPGPWTGIITNSYNAWNAVTLALA